jgi:hypothetical protein
LGVIGEYIYTNEYDSFSALEKLKLIDWKRSSSNWRMRVIRPDGRIIANDKAVILTSNYIKNVLGFELSDDEIAKEKEISY